MLRQRKTLLIFGLAVLMALASTLVFKQDKAVAQGSLGLSCTPYFASPYKVGLSASWNSVKFASQYKVTHFRQDTNGSATVVHDTTGTASGSGLHPNAGAPNNCYYKRATVLALDSEGELLAEDVCAICEVGPP